MSRPVAIVTGAGGGIGGACALALADAGHDIAAVDRDARALGATQVLIARAGATVVGIDADAADAPAMVAALERTRDELGPVDVAVAAVAHEQHGDALAIGAADLETSVAGTAGAALALAQPVARQMIAARRPGRIVLVGSLHGTLPFAATAAYNTAQAALLGLARSLARDLLAHRIAVNVVEPGWIDTAGEQRFYSEQQLREAGAKHPWGRLGTPADVAAAVAFLASPQAEYITGAALRVDGGLSLSMTSLPGSSA